MKISIIGGAGTLGAAIAFRLCQSNEIDEICLIDVNASLLKNHIMDLETAFPSQSVYEGNYEDLTGSQIIIIAAGVPNRNDIKSRDVFLQGNISLMHIFGEKIKTYAPAAFIITASNPVDALNYFLYHQFDFNRRQLLGYSLNDSFRFEKAVRSVLNIPKNINVFAPVIGEHGSDQVLLFSQIQINGEMVVLNDKEVNEIREKVDNWFADFNRLNINRTTGWATAAGIGEIIDGLVSNETIETIGSVIVEEQDGAFNSSVGSPIQVSLNGIESIQDWQLTEEEIEGYQYCAQKIKQMVKPYLGKSRRYAK